MMTYEEIIKNEEINIYIKEADKTLAEIGYTEHSFAHVSKVAKDAGNILEKLGYDSHTIELVKIAGYMHDIGNLINRVDHSQSGAIMAFRILDHLNFDPKDIAKIVSAIGNHDENHGMPVSPIAAALILADKGDVRRSRVRNQDRNTFDIHDRVNYSVFDSKYEINGKKIILKLKLDTDISSVMEFFEIFMTRMIMCTNAAKRLGLEFVLNINDVVVS